MFNKNLLKFKTKLFKNYINGFSTKQNESDPYKDYQSKIILMNQLIYTPFYISTLMLTGVIPYQVPDIVELSRFSIRCIPLTLSITYGLNLTHLHKNFVDRIFRNRDEADTRDLYKKALKCAIPMCLSFLSSQVLLGSSFLTIGKLNLCFMGMISSCVYNVYLTDSNLLNERLLYIDLLYLILNAIMLGLLYLYVRESISKGVNPFKRLNDENRIEELSDIYELKEKDSDILLKENDQLLEMGDKEFQEYIDLLENESK
jgi:hypothetical protein